MEQKDQKVEEQAKKRYQKPEIVYQQHLEAMAALCEGVGAKSPTSFPLCTGTIFS